MPRATIDRTDFGERLRAARRYAKLSQTQLGDAVGLAQSTIAEAERTHQGSSKTAQIAAVTGVSPTWLATGEGAMIASQPPHAAEVRKEYADTPPTGAALAIHPQPSIYNVVQALGRLLEEQSHLSRIAAAPLLQRLAEHPDETDDIARQVQRILTAQGNTAPASSPSQGAQNAGENEAGKRTSKGA